MNLKSGRSKYMKMWEQLETRKSVREGEGGVGGGRSERNSGKLHLARSKIFTLKVCDLAIIDSVRLTSQQKL